jgi:glycosyltransferase involved in cell wall biosynthesis
MLVLIPAFEPDGQLCSIITGILSDQPDLHVLVVDDGSGSQYDQTFDCAVIAGATVIRYPVNRGKGAALRTGFEYALEHFPGESVVTADSDGQHTVRDIVRVAAAINSEKSEIVLGGRRFTGNVPFRSKFGNTFSRTAFRLASGVKVYDTQTGLRGFPSLSLPWLLIVPGDRFEYELNMLMQSAKAGYTLVEIPIETVYREHNASSHFRPLQDSFRVLFPMIAFGLSSFTSFLAEVFALQGLFVLSDSLLFSVVAARILSGSLNFFMNRKIVFRNQQQRSLQTALLGYIALAIALVGASYVSLLALTSIGMALVPAKVLSDVTLYIASFAIQRSFVFGRKKPLPQGQGLLVVQEPIIRSAS